ncbi:MAG: DNA-binding response regulator [Bacteroidetes bacterium]|nr:MAG: DNA-binding response regulator [Bacteroidota bacterium]
MTRIKCLIVDDERMARNLLEEYVLDTPFLELAGKAENSLKAISIMKEIEPGLIFLDIEMPKMNGLNFIRNLVQPPLIILTTAYTTHTIDAFELGVVDYLVKPFSFERFLKAANRAWDSYQAKSNSIPTVHEDFIFVKSDGNLEKVFLHDILYIEAMQNYIMIHTEKKKLLSYLTLKIMEEELPSDNFIKIHKSIIVNQNKIDSIRGHQIQIGNKQVFISQNQYEEVIKKLISDRLIKR